MWWCGVFRFLLTSLTKNKNTFETLQSVKNDNVIDGSMGAQ